MARSRGRILCPGGTGDTAKLWWTLVVPRFAPALGQKPWRERLVQAGSPAVSSSLPGAHPAGLRVPAVPLKKHSALPSAPACSAVGFPKLPPPVRFTCRWLCSFTPLWGCPGIQSLSAARSLKHGQAPSAACAGPLLFLKPVGFDPSKIVISKSQHKLCPISKTQECQKQERHPQTHVL